MYFVTSILLANDIPCILIASRLSKIWGFINHFVCGWIDSWLLRGYDCDFYAGYTRLCAGVLKGI